VHGTGASPRDNWFPWLAEQLSSRRWRLFIPRFPTPGEQQLDRWLAEFESQVGSPTLPLLLVGHSVGSGFILRLLERIEVDVEAAFLVAGWEGLLNNEEFDPLVRSFTEPPYEVEKIKMRCKEFHCYHGDDDPYVPLALAQQLAAKLSAPLTVIPNGGHLNSEAGFHSFRPLLKDILAR